MKSLVLAATVYAMFSFITPARAESGPDYRTEKPDNMPIATFAGGCFWCTESEFRPLPGVLFTIVGYTGGQMESPTYDDISTGQTGHAEALEVYFDPEKTTYTALVEHFLTRAHDPTELNQQWVDKGTQYRSAIFYHNEKQKQQAHAVIDRLSTEKYFKKPIVTELAPAGPFWIAEDYHQNYYDKYRETYGQTHRRVEAKKLMQKEREKERQRR
ncbi:MAG: peptide-methionine (S)-S-oxide reductase MsrA [Alphaproteobacteria bacterium]|nr:peptide-methionine (S)-S-oxide reductase MsrA [Alphaproteobacteria bacterium]